MKLGIDLIVTGESGSGKTHFCGTAEELGEVLYVVFPQQDNNILTLGNLSQRPSIHLCPITKFNDLLEIAGSIPTETVTVVIDPIDFAQDLLKTELIHDGYNRLPRGQTTGRGEDSLALDGYGVLLTRMLNLVSALNSTDKHIIYTTLVMQTVDRFMALAESRSGRLIVPASEEQDTRPYKLTSALEGKLREVIYSRMGPQGFMRGPDYRNSDFTLDFRPNAVVPTNPRVPGLHGVCLANPKFKQVVDACLTGTTPIVKKEESY